MKFAVVLLALASVAFAAPQPRKVFHENFEDFLDIIMTEAKDELNDLLDAYLEHDEFRTSMDYLQTNTFKQLVYEMEGLPEFHAVEDYLDTHSVDISYFIETINVMVEAGLGRPPSRSSRVAISGTDFKSFIADSIALFPKEKLAALYDEKIASDADFAAAIDGLNSEEFQEVFAALFVSPVFQAEVQALNANGIDVESLFDELVAIFGQN